MAIDANGAASAEQAVSLAVTPEIFPVLVEKERVFTEQSEGCQAVGGKSSIVVLLVLILLVAPHHRGRSVA